MLRAGTASESDAAQDRRGRLRTLDPREDSYIVGSMRFINSKLCAGAWQRSTSRVAFASASSPRPPPTTSLLHRTPLLRVAAAAVAVARRFRSLCCLVPPHLHRSSSLQRRSPTMPCRAACLFAAVLALVRAVARAARAADRTYVRALPWPVRSSLEAVSH